MTTENINIVLTNAQCCIGKYAVKVSKLLSMNDNCAESEVVKLKLMNDYFEVACEYNNNPIVDNDNCITPEEFEIVINKLMKVCEICPCQLT